MQKGEMDCSHFSLIKEVPDELPLLNQQKVKYEKIRISKRVLQRIY